MKLAPKTIKQQTSEELRDDLLGFLQRKFYAGEAVAFAKDRRLLLKWVVLFPAGWLNERGVTLPPERYREVFMKVMLEALTCGNTGAIHYRPAWLAKVIQSHFAVHGEEIYEEAKSARALAEHAVFMLGKLRKEEPDPVRELARAASLLVASKPVRKTTVNGQLDLL